tara:strand:+ start:894 stop:2381 length:1488 start_codon:yes stop_codon:yes gene_type:complete
MIKKENIFEVALYLFFISLIFYSCSYNFTFLYFDYSLLKLLNSGILVVGEIPKRFFYIIEKKIYFTNYIYFIHKLLFLIISLIISYFFIYNKKKILFDKYLKTNFLFFTTIIILNLFNVFVSKNYSSFSNLIYVLIVAIFFFSLNHVFIKSNFCEKLKNLIIKIYFLYFYFFLINIILVIIIYFYNSSGITEMMLFEKDIFFIFRDIKYSILKMFNTFFSSYTNPFSLIVFVKFFFLISNNNKLKNIIYLYLISIFIFYLLSSNLFLILSTTLLLFKFYEKKIQINLIFNASFFILIIFFLFFFPITLNFIMSLFGYENFLLNINSYTGKIFHKDCMIDNDCHYIIDFLTNFFGKETLFSLYVSFFNRFSMNYEFLSFFYNNPLVYLQDIDNFKNYITDLNIKKKESGLMITTHNSFNYITLRYSIFVTLLFIFSLYLLSLKLLKNKCYLNLLFLFMLMGIMLYDDHLIMNNLVGSICFWVSLGLININNYEKKF